MDNYFKINHSQKELRSGTLVIGGLELATPLLVHSGNVIRYLRPEQVTATNTKALYYDPIKNAEELGKANLKELPNLRQVLDWQGALFTTSGAVEIAKLAKPRGYKVKEVNFRLPNKGQLINLSPSEAIKVQEQLGANITEQLYRDVNYYAPVDDLAAAVDTTSNWYLPGQEALFPVTGGGLRELHVQSIASVTGEQPWGYLITQTEQIDSLVEIKRNLSMVVKMLPNEGLRVTKTKASFEQLTAALSSGIDVIYSDVALHEAVMGNALVSNGKRLKLAHESFAKDWSALDSECQCAVCTSHYSRAYLHYLAKTNSPQYVSLILEHNLYWLNQFVINFYSQVG